MQMAKMNSLVSKQDVEFIDYYTMRGSNSA
jgi:hypothetical protein